MRPRHMRRPYAFKGGLNCLRGIMNLRGAVPPSWARCLHAVPVMGQFHRHGVLWAPYNCADAILSTL